MATFGNTLTASTTFAASAANTGAFAKGVLSESGSVSKLTYRTRTETGSANVKGLIYTDNAGAPGTLVGTSQVTSIGVTLQGYDLTFATPVSLSAGTYWVGMVTDGVVRNYYEAADGNYYDSAAGFSYASPPGTFSGGSGGIGAYECYATYTASGGAVNSNFFRFF